MIILNETQADTVRGPTGPGAALDPVALANGTEWVLPEAVLTAPEHAIHHALLSELPKRSVAPSEFPQGEV